jgi:hypothetical protein
MELTKIFLRRHGNSFTDMLAIIQEMHTEAVVLNALKLGMMICIPKIIHPTEPGDYRILTLLNANLKMMARIIANRLDHWLPSIIHTSQQCGIRGHRSLMLLPLFER